jgi:hypothetical protein
MPLYGTEAFASLFQKHENMCSDVAMPNYPSLVKRACLLHYSRFEVWEQRSIGNDLVLRFN